MCWHMCGLLQHHVHPLSSAACGPHRLAASPPDAALDLWKTQRQHGSAPALFDPLHRSAAPQVLMQAVELCVIMPVSVVGGTSRHQQRVMHCVAQGGVLSRSLSRRLWCSVWSVMGWYVYHVPCVLYVRRWCCCYVCCFTCGVHTGFGLLWMRHAPVCSRCGMVFVCEVHNTAVLHHLLVRAAAAAGSPCRSSPHNAQESVGCWLVPAAMLASALKVLLA